MIVRALSLLAGGLLLTACTARAETVPIASVDMCGAVVVRDHPVEHEDLVHGCTRTDGTLLMIPWQRCHQGVVLAHLRFESGDFWGYEGSVWHHVSLLDDSVRYQAAARSCWSVPAR